MDSFFLGRWEPTFDVTPLTLPQDPMLALVSWAGLLGVQKSLLTLSHYPQGILKTNRNCGDTQGPQSRSRAAFLS